MNFGVYVHIPFCEQRCSTAFTVAVSSPETYEPYVRRLIREIELSGFHETETVSLAERPSIIDAGLLEHILHVLPAGAREIRRNNPGTR
jgi:coproporphyrinogen III oxidase-like Fe-S oxidoreductase